MGLNNDVGGDYSTAIGENVNVSGRNAFGIGKNVKVIGEFGFAQGVGTQAQWDYCTAMGDSAICDSDSGFAIGEWTRTYGEGSSRYQIALGAFAEANGTRTNGQGSDNAMAIGGNLYSQGDDTIIIGTGDSVTNFSRNLEENSILFVNDGEKGLRINQTAVKSYRNLFVTGTIYDDGVAVLTSEVDGSTTNELDYQRTKFNMTWMSNVTGNWTPKDSKVKSVIDTAYPNLDTDSSNDFSGAYSALTGRPQVMNTSWFINNQTVKSSMITNLCYDTESELTTALNDNYVAIGTKLGNSTTEIQAVAVGGEVSGTVGSITINNDALDDQYYDSEADLTGLLNDNYFQVGNLSVMRNASTNGYDFMSLVQIDTGAGTIPSLSTGTGLLVSRNDITSRATGIAIISGTAGVSFIDLGDSGSATSGRVYYDNTADTMSLKTGGATRINMNSTGLTVKGDIFDDGVNINTLYESATSNAFDPDRLNGDTVDNDLLDDAVVSNSITIDTAQNITTTNLNVVCNVGKTVCWKTYIDGSGNLLTVKV
jgi:hypothetical protein